MTEKEKEIVLKILDENSGGMKFIELLAEMGMKQIKININTIEKELKEMKELKLVKYVWKSMNREKIFVCTK